MVTDDERREVAQRLRESWKKTWHGEKMMHRLREVLGIDQHVSTFGKFRYYRAVAERLADLIDPGGVIEGVTLSTDGVGEALPEALDAYDRDALIKLAVELDQKSLELLKTNDLDSNRKRRGMRRTHASDLMAASSRIREALGAVE